MAEPAAGDDDATACAERALERIAAIDGSTAPAEIESRIKALVSTLVDPDASSVSTKVEQSVVVRGVRALLEPLKTLEKCDADDGCLSQQLQTAFGARWLAQYMVEGDLPEALALLILVTERALGVVAKAAKSFLLQEEDIIIEDMSIFLADVEQTSFSRIKEIIKLGKKFSMLSCSHAALDDLGLARSTNSARFLEHATGRLTQLRARRSKLQEKLKKVAEKAEEIAAKKAKDEARAARREQAALDAAAAPAEKAAAAAQKKRARAAARAASAASQAAATRAASAEEVSAAATEQPAAAAAPATAARSSASEGVAERSAASGAAIAGEAAAPSAQASRDAVAPRGLERAAVEITGVEAAVTAQALEQSGGSADSSTEPLPPSDDPEPAVRTAAAPAPPRHLGAAPAMAAPGSSRPRSASAAAAATGVPAANDLERQLAEAKELATELERSAARAAARAVAEQQQAARDRQRLADTVRAALSAAQRKRDWFAAAVAALRAAEEEVERVLRDFLEGAPGCHGQEMAAALDRLERASAVLEQPAMSPASTVPASTYAAAGAGDSLRAPASSLPRWHVPLPPRAPAGAWGRARPAIPGLSAAEVECAICMDAAAVGRTPCCGQTAFCAPCAAALTGCCPLCRAALPGGA